MYSDRLITRIRNASGITFLTGKGICAESIKKTDEQWDPKKVEKLYSVHALNQNPELFWKYFFWLRQQVSKLKPNLAHYALVDMERLAGHFALLTQNIDNLHRLAGSKRLLELYGNIMRDRCIKCGKRYPAKTGEFTLVPTCTECDGLLRPDIILNGENIENKFIETANKASAACEVFFSIGNAVIEEPAAALPYMAKANGAYVVEINETDTQFSSHANECIRNPASDALPQLAIEFEKLFS